MFALFCVIFALFFSSAAALAANSADLIDTSKYSLKDQRVVNSGDYNSTRKLLLLL